jgi:hypothetical protein
MLPICYSPNYPGSPAVCKVLLMELPTVTHVDHLITALVDSCQHSQVGHINGAPVGTVLD